GAVSPAQAASALTASGGSSGGGKRRSFGFGIRAPCLDWRSRGGSASHCPLASPRKRGPIFQRRWLWVPAFAGTTVLRADHSDLVSSWRGNRGGGGGEEIS